VDRWQTPCFRGSSDGGIINSCWFLGSGFCQRSHRLPAAALPCQAFLVCSDITLTTTAEALANQLQSIRETPNEDIPYPFSADEENGSLRLALLMAATLIPFGEPAVAASGGCTIDRDEQTVLTTVLQSVTTHSRSVLMVESRTDSSHFARTFSLSELLLREATSELSSQLKAAPNGSTVFLPMAPSIIPPSKQQELEKEYSVKLRQPCTIPIVRNISKQVVFRTPIQLHRILSGADLTKGWARFHQMFGEEAEIVTFSRVAFDRTKQYGLVHVSSGISANGGGGELYLLSRQNGNWAITHKFSTWAT